MQCNNALFSAHTFIKFKEPIEHILKQMLPRLVYKNVLSLTLTDLLKSRILYSYIKIYFLTCKHFLASTPEFVDDKYTVKSRNKTYLQNFTNLQLFTLSKKKRITYYFIMIHVVNLPFYSLKLSAEFLLSLQIRTQYLSFCLLFLLITLLSLCFPSLHIHLQYPTNTVVQESSQSYFTIF